MEKVRGEDMIAKMCTSYVGRMGSDRSSFLPSAGSTSPFSSRALNALSVVVSIGTGNLRVVTFSPV